MSCRGRNSAWWQDAHSPSGTDGHHTAREPASLQHLTTPRNSQNFRNIGAEQNACSVYGILLPLSHPPQQCTQSIRLPDEGLSRLPEGIRAFRARLPQRIIPSTGARLRVRSAFSTHCCADPARPFPASRIPQCPASDRFTTSGVGKVQTHIVPHGEASMHAAGQGSPKLFD
jgi:hypothetical protein